MRWAPPSAEAQDALIAPLMIPLLILTAPFWLLLAALIWLDRQIPQPPADWAPWFAWWPVRLNIWWGDESDYGKWVWLETVEHRRLGGFTEHRSLRTPDTDAGPCQRDGEGSKGEACGRPDPNPPTQSGKG